MAFELGFIGYWLSEIMPSAVQRSEEGSVASVLEMALLCTCTWPSGLRRRSGQLPVAKVGPQ